MGLSLRSKKMAHVGRFETPPQLDISPQKWSGSAS
jgi:hypothetical protein